MDTLTTEELQLLIDAMEFTRQRFEAYPYDSADFKRQRLQEVDDLRGKLREMRKQKKAAHAPSD